MRLCRQATQNRSSLEAGISQLQLSKARFAHGTYAEDGAESASASHRSPFGFKCRDGGFQGQESQAAATAFTQKIFEIERMAAGLTFKVAHGVQDVSIENDCSPNIDVSD